MVSLVHSWQRRRGLFLSICLGPSNWFAGAGFARQTESTRDRSLTPTHPKDDFDMKVGLDTSGFSDMCLVSYVMPLWMSPMTLKRVPDPLSWVSTKMAWWFRGIPKDSTR